MLGRGRREYGCQGELERVPKENEGAEKVSL